MPSFINPNKNQLFQEESRFLNGLDEVLIKNIKVCEYLKNFLKSCFGPNAKNKLIVQKNGNYLITSDTLTILKNFDFIHPVLKILIDSALYQIQDSGDFGNYFVLLCTELLKKAHDLLLEGYHLNQIIENFEKAGILSLEALEKITCYRLGKLNNLKILSNLLGLSIKTDINDLKNIIAPQVANACLNSCPLNQKKFSGENIRIVKILGGNVNDIKTLTGTIILRDSEGPIKTVKKANVLIYMCDFEFSNIDNLNSIEFEKISDILEYEKKEHFLFEKKISTLKNLGINVIIANRFGDTVLHFLQKYNIMAIKVQSKFDIKRIAKTCGSMILPNIRKPNKMEIGTCDFVSVRSFGVQKVIIFKQEILDNKMFTIVIRGNSTNILENTEKTILKLILLFKSILRDDRFVIGGGSCEIQINKKMKEFLNSENTMINRKIFEKFNDAFILIPSLLIENIGGNSINIISQIYNEYKKGDFGIGVDSREPRLINCRKCGIWDHYYSKYWAIRNAIDSALMILTIDQIIIAKHSSENDAI